MKKNNVTIILSLLLSFKSLLLMGLDVKNEITDVQDIENYRISNSDEISWQQIGPGQGGGINGMAIDPGDSDFILYFNDMNSYYKSINGGVSFTPSHNFNKGFFENPADANTIHYSTVATNIIYAGGPRGVFKSIDRGVTWNSISQSYWPDLRQVYTLAIDKNNENIIYAGCSDRREGVYTRRGIYRTIDGGTTWIAINNGLKTGNDSLSHLIKRIIIDPHDSNIIYCATGDGFYKSNDQGSNWTLSVNGLPHDRCNGFDLTLGLPGDINNTSSITLAVIIDAVNELEGSYQEFKGGVYISIDRGATWIEKNGDLKYDLAEVTSSTNTGIGLQKFGEIRFEPKNANVMYTGLHDWSRASANPYGLFRTVNGGTTWKNLTRVQYNGIWQNGLGPGIILERQQEIIDNGSNVDNVTCPAMEGIRQICISPTNPSNIFFTASDDTYKSTNYGETWQALSNTKLEHGHYQGHGNGNLCVRKVVFHPVIPNKRIYLPAHDGGLYWTNDGGDSINGGTYYNYGLASKFQFVKLSSMPVIAYDPDDSNIIYCCGGAGWGARPLKFFKSIDYGITFDEVSTIVAESGKASFVRNIIVDDASPVDNRTIYVTPAQNIDRNFLVPSTLKGEGIKVSSDSGKTWGELNNGFGESLNVMDLKINPRNKNIMFAALISYKSADGIIYSGGLYKSDDGGQNWYLQSPSYLEDVASIAINWDYPSVMYISTHDKGPGTYGYTEFNDWDDLLGGVWKSEDSGVTWTQIFMTTNCRTVEISPFNSNIILTSASTSNGGSYLTRNPGAYLSKNGGLSWQKVCNGLSIANITAYTFHPKNQAEVWCGTDGGSWYKGMFQFSVNILKNGMFKENLDNWVESDCNKWRDTYEYDERSIGNIYVYNRNSQDSRITQYITEQIKESGSGTYHFSFWVYTYSTAPEQIKTHIWYKTENGEKSDSFLPVRRITQSDRWQKFEGDLVFDDFNSLESAMFYINTDSYLDNFHINDVVLYKKTNIRAVLKTGSFLVIR